MCNIRAQRNNVSGPLCIYASCGVWDMCSKCTAEKIYTANSCTARSNTKPKCINSKAVHKSSRSRWFIPGCLNVRTDLANGKIIQNDGLAELLRAFGYMYVYMFCEPIIVDKSGFALNFIWQKRVAIGSCYMAGFCVLLTGGPVELALCVM